MNIRALQGEEMTGTDAEACAYLMTVSLTQPIDSDWTQIYLYVSKQVFKGCGKGDMPADIAVDSITEYQKGKLKHLKTWLYRQRIKVREERDREERRQQKEQAEMKKEVEHPALFEL